MPFSRPISEEQYQTVKGHIRTTARRKFPGDEKRQDRYVYGSKIIQQLRGKEKKKEP